MGDCEGSGSEIARRYRERACGERGAPLGYRMDLLGAL